MVATRKKASLKRYWSTSVSALPKTNTILALQRCVQTTVCCNNEVAFLQFTLFLRKNLFLERESKCAQARSYGLQLARACCGSPERLNRIQWNAHQCLDPRSIAWILFCSYCSYPLTGRKYVVIRRNGKK